MAGGRDDHRVRVRKTFEGTRWTSGSSRLVLGPKDSFGVPGPCLDENMPTPRAKAVYDGFQRGAAGAQTGALETRCMSPRMYQMSYSKTLNDSVHKQIYADAAGVRSGGIHERKIKQTTTTNPSRCESVDMIVFARDLDLSRLRNKGSDS